MSILNERFATAITCIDGRVQRPVSDWVKLKTNVHHVDLITEPGPDKVLSEGPTHMIDEVMRKVAFSVRHHFSPVVALAGHDNCAGNPVSREEPSTRSWMGLKWFSRIICTCAFWDCWSTNGAPSNFYGTRKRRRTYVVSCDAYPRPTHFSL